MSPPDEERRPGMGTQDGANVYAASDDSHHDNPELGDDDIPLEWRIRYVIDQATWATAYAAHRRSVLESWPTQVLRDLVWAGVRDEVIEVVDSILAERGVGW